LIIINIVCFVLHVYRSRRPFPLKLALHREQIIRKFLLIYKKIYAPSIFLFPYTFYFFFLLINLNDISPPYISVGKMYIKIIYNEYNRQFVKYTTILDGFLLSFRVSRISLESEFSSLFFRLLFFSLFFYFSL